MKTEEIKKWVKEKGYLTDIDDLSRIDVLKHLNKNQILELLSYYNEIMLLESDSYNWKDICFSAGICGVVLNDNPTGRKTILCKEECPICQVKEV